MAELDASIPLQVRPPQGIDMLQMLSHVAQLKQAQAQLKLIPLEMQQRQAQIQDTQAQIQQRQRDLEATQKLQGLFADPANHDAFAKGDYSAITEQVSPNIAMPAIEKLNEMQNKAQSLRGEQAKFYAEGRGRLQDLIQSIDPSQPQAPQQFAQGVQALGQEHPELVKQLQPPQQGQDFGQYLNGLATVNGLGHKILENAAALKAKESESAGAAGREQRAIEMHPLQMAEAQQKALAAQQKATGTEPIQPVDQARLAFDKARVDQQVQRALEMARHNRADENEMQRYHSLNVEGVALSDDAKQKMAEMFASTGALPNLGMGKAAAQNRSDIINMAAKNFPNVDFATNKAQYQANTTSLKNVQKISDQVDAFENTAGKNIDIFLKAAKDVVDTGSPLLNKPVRVILGQLGNDKVAAFNAARETALTEAAKVLESPQGGSALTVSGRDAIKTLSSPSATFGQQVSAMKVLRQDMANRKQSNTEQIQAIQDRIKAGNPNNKPSENKDPLGIR